MSIEFRELSKSFEANKPVLRKLSFELPHGKFSGLLGPSGCGKTTLLRIVAGLDSPDMGSLRVGDETLVDVGRGIFVSPEKRNIGMVFQSYAVWPHLSVFENVAFPLRVRRLPKGQIEAEVKEALRIVRLEGLEKRLPHALSGGQQQRVSLARALVQKPRLLLLDEPLSNLDVNLRSEMRVEIRQLQQSLGLTAVIVTHDWADARALCDHVVVLNGGRIEQAGSSQELMNSPASEFVRSFAKAGL